MDDVGVSLLTSIIDAATAPDVDVASLLRKVKVVGSRLDTDELSGWVNHELNGYPLDAGLPPYRGPFPAEVMGLFVGPFNSQMTLAIPSQKLIAFNPSAERLFGVSFHQPVAEIAEQARGDGQDRAGMNLQSPWPANALALINGLISKGTVQLVPMHNLAAAWRVITPAQLRAVIDNVVTRVLGLALDLEKLEPNAGEPDASLPADPAQITTVVHNNICGSGNSVAIGSHDVTQQIGHVEAGNIESLLLALRNIGMAESDISELHSAIVEDAAEGTNIEPGPRVRAFLGRFMLKTGGVAGKIGIGAAATTVGALIKAYYHLG